MMKSNFPKISIITINFNGEKTIRETIESVLNQTYSNIQYILIDGDSDDGSHEIIKEYEDKIDILIKEKDGGLYDALNKGISIATGDYIGLLHSDDTYSSKNVIAEIVNSIKGDDIDCILSNVRYMNKNGKKSLRKLNALNFKPWMIRFGWMPPHLGMFIKKKVFEDYGFYLRDFKISADFELVVRIMIKERISYKAIDFTSVLMRKGGKSTKNIISNFIITKEMYKGCKVNGVYTNYLLLLSRIPIKFISQFL